jgi:hypothetical protein
VDSCRDGWDVPLAQALILLRDVAQRLRMPNEHVTYTLELAAILSTLPRPAVDALALATGCGQVPEPLSLCKGAVQALVTGVSDIMRSSIIKGASADKWVPHCCTAGPLPLAGWRRQCACHCSPEDCGLVGYLGPEFASLWSAFRSCL